MDLTAIRSFVKQKLTTLQLPTSQLELDTAIDKAFADLKEELQNQPTVKKRSNAFWVAMILMPLAAGVLTLCPLPHFTDFTDASVKGLLGGFLAFVVALSAYLANVSREITRLFPCKQPRPKPEFCARISPGSLLLTRNLFCYASLHCCALPGPINPHLLGTSTQFSLDRFLLLHLGVILVGLAANHLRILRWKKPWMI